LVDRTPSEVESSEVQRPAANSLQLAADPVAAELHAALALRLAGGGSRDLRRALLRALALLDG
jgi:hypothetical protein